MSKTMTSENDPMRVVTASLYEGIGPALLTYAVTRDMRDSLTLGAGAALGFMAYMLTPLNGAGIPYGDTLAVGAGAAGIIYYSGEMPAYELAALMAMAGQMGFRLVMSQVYAT